MNIGILSIKKATGGELPETIRLHEEIQQLGHESVLLNYRRMPIGILEEGRTFYRVDQSGKKLMGVEVDSIIPRIGKYTSEGVLALRALEYRGIPATASAEAVRVSKDKIESQLLLDRAGIPTPHSVMIPGRIPDDPRELLKLVEPNWRRPVIIKTAAGSHGKGVVKAESRTSARSFLDAYESGPVLIQEFIEPVRDGYHDDVRMIVAKGKVVTAMRRFVKTDEDEQEFRANLSLGGSGEIYEPTLREEEMAIRAAETVGLEVAGVDFMHSSRGPLVTEVNDNLEFGIERVTGFNVASMIALIAVEKALAKQAANTPLLQDN